ncbi:zf-HC2 domain-containing protein [Corallococcus macrosporus]|uniref:Zf-HC2 domain-containing protein n=1 Tax=Corallococcus macrosporus TaxID=35 RepID=A0ABS3DIV1_9BACT|nr:zf-HC2 domain-containing protein [Corallococcus macrosporus]
MSGCSETWRERISEYFDGEASASESARAEAHLAACAACRQLAERYAGLRMALRGAASLPTVPRRLRTRIEVLGEGGGPPSAAARVHLPRSAPMRRLAAAAAALLLAVGLLWTGWPRGFNEVLAADLERHHLRAFSRAQPCEFESSDRTAVRAWARAQTGEEVEVPDVPGARLLGARRCRLDGRITISLLYRYGNHALTLFAPPRGSSAGAQGLAFAQKGPRCTKGPVGERICVVARGDDVTIAVSELGDSVLLSALSTPDEP